MYEIIREIGGDLIENVEEIMEYKDPKTQKVSKAYRICFRSLERTLENSEITKYQMKIRDVVGSELKSVKLR